MQKWMLPAGLAAAAVLVAYLLGPLTRPASQPQGAQPPTATPPTPPVPEVGTSTGSLLLDARLDQQVLLAGGEDDRYLVVKVTAPETARSSRQPVDVSVVMDISGSMSGRGKINYAKAAAQELVESLTPEDRFSLVTFSDRATTLWPGQPVLSKRGILTAIRSIQEGGGTNMYDGLLAGIEQLKSGEPGRVRRMVLLSDGHANVGLSDNTSLSNLAGREATEGISTSAIGLGLDYNEDLLAMMADSGGGSYHFVDHPAQLAEIFSQELTTMTEAVARNATLRINLERGVQAVDVYGYQDPVATDHYEVFMGDIYAGQVRKLVMRLDVPPCEEQKLSIARVQLEYSDLTSQPVDEILDAQSVTAAITTDSTVASSSLHRESSILATRAQAAEMAEQAARAFQRNDRAAAQRELGRASVMLQQGSSSLNAPELLEDDATYSEAAPIYQMAAPSSAMGRRALKQQKEASREYAH